MWRCIHWYVDSAGRNCLTPFDNHVSASQDNLDIVVHISKPELLEWRRYHGKAFRPTQRFPGEARDYPDNNFLLFHYSNVSSSVSEAGLTFEHAYNVTLALGTHFVFVARTGNTTFEDSCEMLT